MSHEIMRNDSIMYSGSSPWHGLGTYVGEQDVTVEVALRMSGLDWHVEQRNLFFGGEVLRSGDMPADRIVKLQAPEGKAQVALRTNGEATLFRLHDAPSHVANIRSDTGALLGVVGNKYAVVQNRGAFAFLDKLVETGEIRIHTAGSLRNGKRVWILASLGEAEVVPEDRVGQFILFWNSHDGSSAVRVTWTTVRVVCANTARAALSGSKDDDGITIRHSGDMSKKLEQARKALGLAKTAHQKELEAMQALSRRRVSRDEIDGLLEELYPVDQFLTVPEDNRTQGQKASLTRAQKAQEEIVDALLRGDGAQMQGVKGTAWGLYNAITQVESRRPVRGQGTTLESVLWGTGNQRIQQAADFLMSLVADHDGAAKVPVTTTSRRSTRA